MAFAEGENTCDGKASVANYSILRWPCDTKGKNVECPQLNILACDEGVWLYTNIVHRPARVGHARPVASCHTELVSASQNNDNAILK